jgi:hypothetical protein
MMTMQHSVIQGKLVPYMPMRLPIKDIKLDPANPRVQYLVGQTGEAVTQDRLDEVLWDKDQVKALAQSIYQNGGVREPIIVQKVDDTFIVREGNCRTVGNRHLSEQYPGDDRFSSIPAHVYERELSEEDLAVILADMHVAKKISWDAYEQAKVIHDLSTIHGKTYDWLSNHLRLSKSKISENLKAYKAATEYLNVSPNPENIRKFSFFQEIMKKRELRESFEESSEFRLRFHRWLDEDRITDARQVRSLPAIMANPAALAALEEQGFDAASRVLITNDPSLGSDLFHAVKAATEALKVAPISDIQDLKLGNPQKLIMLRNLKRALEDLSTLAGLQL